MPKSPDSRSSRVPAVDHAEPLRRFEHDGVRLASQCVGPPPRPGAATPSPMLFIHGNSCDHAFFADQVARFATERFVAAVDLRGHGVSDAPPAQQTPQAPQSSGSSANTMSRKAGKEARADGRSDGYGFAALAADCLAIMQTLDAEFVPPEHADSVALADSPDSAAPRESTGPPLAPPPWVVVGHSMGGAVAVELAVAAPERVAGLVILDATLIPDREAITRSLPGVLTKMRGPDYLEAFRRFFETLFEPGADENLKASVWERMRATPQHVMIALLEDLRDYAGAPLEQLARQAPRLPIRYVAASRWRSEPDALQRVLPGVDLVQLEDCGHFLTLEAPRRVNALLEDFLRRLEGAEADAPAGSFFPENIEDIDENEDAAPPGESPASGG